MGSFSAWHWILVLLIILIVFGAGRLPNVMGDLAKGVKAFRNGMRDDSAAPPATPVNPGPAHPGAGAGESPAPPAGDRPKVES